MWIRHFTNYNIISHSTKQDTLPIVFLISKQVILYWTRGGTYCPGVSTPKIRSLAGSSTTCHDSVFVIQYNLEIQLRVRKWNGMGMYIRLRHPPAKPTMCVMLMTKFGKAEKTGSSGFGSF
jgi:hypothetical protein